MNRVLRKYVSLVAIASFAISSGCAGAQRQGTGGSALGGVVSLGGVVVGLGTMGSCMNPGTECTGGELGAGLGAGLLLIVLGGFIVAADAGEGPREAAAADDGGSAAVVVEGATTLAARRAVRAAAAGDCETARAEMSRIARENPPLHDTLARREALRRCGVVPATR